MAGARAAGVLAAATGTLSFEASAIELPAAGKLTVAYLRSYEGMGRARLWLDDENSARLGPGKMDWYMPEVSRFTQLGGLEALSTAAE